MALSFKSDHSEVTNDTLSSITNLKSNVENTYGEIEKKINTSLQQSVVGINVNYIPQMKQAIEGYINDVNTELAKLQNYDPNIAFKGTEIEAKLRVYIDNVIEACGNVVSYLNMFSDQLTQIQDAYVNKDISAASSINIAAESTKAGISSYQGAGSSAS